nr:MAG TPA: putative transcriptional regulator [Caudoviricetes sp.]
MTDKQFNAAFTAALSAPDRDAFVSDWALSSLFAREDETATVDQALVEELGQVWDVAHLSVSDIRSATGLIQRDFAARHCIPCRTIEDWERGARSCPNYLRLLLAQAEGLYIRKNKGGH